MLPFWQECGWSLALSYSRTLASLLLRSVVVLSWHSREGSCFGAPYAPS